MKTKQFLAAAMVVANLFILSGHATAATAGTAPAGQSDNSAYSKPGFHTEMHDGRLWVFKAGSEELKDFQTHGELAKHVIRPGAGPDGITLKAPDAETLDEYLSTH